jgi:hypothetical protein
MWPKYDVEMRKVKYKIDYCNTQMHVLRKRKKLLLELLRKMGEDRFQRFKKKSI